MEREVERMDTMDLFEVSLQDASREQDERDAVENRYSAILEQEQEFVEEIVATYGTTESEIKDCKGLDRTAIYKAVKESNIANKRFNEWLCKGQIKSIWNIIATEMDAFYIGRYSGIENRAVVNKIASGYYEYFNKIDAHKFLTWVNETYNIGYSGNINDYPINTMEYVEQETMRKEQKANKMHLKQLAKDETDATAKKKASKPKKKKTGGQYSKPVIRYNIDGTGAVYYESITEAYNQNKDILHRTRTEFSKRLKEINNAEQLEENRDSILTMGDYRWSIDS